MDVMQQFSYTMGLKMFDCRDKLHPSTVFNEDIINFWNKDHNLNEVATGCLIFCTMVALDLVGTQGEVLVANAKGFLMAKGADDETIKILLELSDNCARDMTQTHHCAAALELAICFRQGIWELGWTPDIRPLLETRRINC